jgi:MFS transporter, putative metabolite:H+ symporter
MGGALAMALAGYWHDVYIGAVSVFFLLIMAQRFFGDASYAIIGALYSGGLAEPVARQRHGLQLWHQQSRQIIGPLGLALIVGSSNYVSPKVTLEALFPALLFLAFCMTRRGLCS